jgi:Mlc titration factor MtfA (ptsG expression regulator)
MRLFRRRTHEARIGDAHWAALVATYPFVQAVGPQRLARLRTLTDEFLGCKRFAGAADLSVDDHIGTSIALQACLPVVELGLHWYDDFEQVIVYPDQFLVPRTHADEAGVVHEELAALAGEALPGGPVVLSWADASADSDDGWNVVIHEFVHKLDLRDGEADGIPPLPGARRRVWRAALDDAYRAFRRQLVRVERAIPRGIDPDGPAADAYYADLPLDPYAAQDPAEFFAVCSEAFFLDPDLVEAHFPSFFQELANFFGFIPRDGSVRDGQR